MSFPIYATFDFVQSISMPTEGVQRQLTEARHRRTCKMLMGRVAGIETEAGIGAYARYKAWSEYLTTVS